MQEKNCLKLEVVPDVWQEFIADFEKESLLLDQILIISDSVYLRGPSLDLIAQYQTNKKYIN